MPDPQTVNMVSEDGSVHPVSADAVAAAIARGMRVEGEQERIGRLVQEQRSEEVSGVGNTIAAGIQSGANAFTLGGYGALVGAAGGGDLYNQLEEAHPTASMIGGIAGTIAPALASGGTSLLARGGEEAAVLGLGKLAAATPAGLVARAGTRIAERGGESALGRIAATTAAGAFEGGAQGAGAYISDVALGNRDLSADAFIGAMGRGALYGGIAGGAFATSEKALTTVRRMFPRQEMTREVVDRAANEATQAVSEAVSDADATVMAARQRMRDLRAQRAALDLQTKTELDAIAVAKARDLADAQVTGAQAKAEAEVARADRVKAGPARRTRKALGGDQPAPPVESSTSGATTETTSVGSTPPPASWREFSSSKMGEYMRTEGGHAGAMRRLSEEWKALKSGGGPVAGPESAATALERQLAGTKAGLDAGMNLTDIAAQRPAAIGLKQTHVEDALNAHVAKTDPEMAKLVRAVAEVEDSKTAVSSWLEKYGGSGQVGKFERSQAARDVAESWRSKQAGYYSKTPAGEGSARLPRGREWEFRGSEADRKAMEDAFYARQGDASARQMLEAGIEPPSAGGRSALESAKRVMPTAKEIAAEVADSPKIEEAIAGALKSKVKNIDEDIALSSKAIGRMEAAQADLTEALGADAPIGAQARAKELRTAQREAEQKTATQGAAVAEGADKAASTINLPSAGEKAGVVGQAMRVGDIVEALHMMGIPVPDVKDIPVIGPVLKQFLRARVLAKAFGRFGGKTVETAESAIASKAAMVRQRVNTAVDTMLGKAASGAAYLAPIAGGPAAVLGHSLFDDGAKREPPKGKADLVTLYKARMEELSRATPDAIIAMVKDKVRAADPALVDTIAQAQIRKLQFIDSKAPRPSEPDGLLGGLPWTPSRAALSTWVRYIEAAEDPAGVMERAAKGGIITVEAIEAVKQVYPNLYLDAQKRAITLLADNTTKLPFARRAQLSTLFDLPLDTASSPQYAAWLQEGYKAKPTPAAQQALQQPPTPTIAADVSVGMRTDPTAT